MLALAEGNPPALRDGELDGLELGAAMRVVAPGLILGTTAGAPAIDAGLKLQRDGTAGGDKRLRQRVAAQVQAR